MKIVTIVGARPQFIKTVPVSRALAQAGHTECLVHTGQHYDYNMSKVFFDELGIKSPAHNLEVGPNSSSKQIGEMLHRLEDVLRVEKPDCLLLYGDTNSTLAGALAGVKLGIPVAHVEAGERNFFSRHHQVHPSAIPEETNRVLTDHVSTILFCASNRAVANLDHEGIHQGVYLTGDVMLDVFLEMSARQDRPIGLVAKLGLGADPYVLATVHRAVNTDDPHRLAGILRALAGVSIPVVFPVHPRTRKCMDQAGLTERFSSLSNIKLIDPVGYFEMLELERAASVIVTDSGGVTREAYFCGVPGVIVDDTTAWFDLVATGWSRLTGASSRRIQWAVKHAEARPGERSLLGNGHAAAAIVRCLEGWRNGF